MRECCGTCKWNRYDRNSGIRHGEFSCGNEDSSEYGALTWFNDVCDDWEEDE